MQSASGLVGWSANLCADTVLGALDIVGSKQTVLPSGGSHSPGEMGSEPEMDKEGSTVLNFSVMRTENKNKDHLWSAGDIRAERLEGLSGFNPLGSGCLPPAHNSRTHTHRHAHTV